MKTEVQDSTISREFILNVEQSKSGKMCTYNCKKAKNIDTALVLVKRNKVQCYYKNYIKTTLAIKLFFKRANPQRISYNIPASYRVLSTLLFLKVSEFNY
jgi:hypothetical protein